MNLSIQKIDGGGTSDSVVSIGSTEAYLPSDQTFGGYIQPTMPLGTDNPLRSAWRLVNSLENGAVADQARQILTSLHNILTHSAGDKSNLPEMEAALLDDGSLLLEWALPEFRVGIGIEKDSRNSGWFVVSTSRVGGIKASDLLTADFRGILSSLITTVIFST
ncbi:MAG: hypothetical protein FJ319_00580 [SAR202 cluster bacterium]|nr:hypothetical protein [SAR202 cluster bacterium]